MFQACSTGTVQPLEIVMRSGVKCGMRRQKFRWDGEFLVRGRWRGRPTDDRRNRRASRSWSTSALPCRTRPGPCAFANPVPSAICNSACLHVCKGELSVSPPILSVSLPLLSLSLFLSLSLSFYLFLSLSIHLSLSLSLALALALSLFLSISLSLSLSLSHSLSLSLSLSLSIELCAASEHARV